MATNNSGRIAVIVSRYPCLTETFIYHEIVSLEQHGYEVDIFCCSPRSACDHWIKSNTRGQVDYVPSAGLWFVLSRILLAIAAHPIQMASLVASALRFGRHDVRGVWQCVFAVSAALYWKKLVKRCRITHVHAHFLHRPAVIANLLARLTDVHYSVSAHGRDVYSPDFRIDRLCRDARFLCVCSQQLRDELLRRIDQVDAERVFLCHHGVSLNGFAFRDECQITHNGDASILTISRLVPKKGVDVVLRAAAILRSRGVRYQLTIVGDGPENSPLRELAQQLNLQDVDFLGALDHQSVCNLYRRADLFVTGSRVAADGDRDGIPNVIVEAMALGVPVLAANAGGVAEIVRHEETGWLVPPDDPVAMADGVERLLTDAALRTSVTQRARQEVVSHFDLRKNVNRLIGLLESQEGVACTP